MDESRKQSIAAKDALFKKVLNGKNCDEALTKSLSTDKKFLYDTGKVGIEAYEMTFKPGLKSALKKAPRCD